MPCNKGDIGVLATQHNWYRNHKLLISGCRLNSGYVRILDNFLSFLKKVTFDVIFFFNHSSIQNTYVRFFFL